MEADEDELDAYVMRGHEEEDHQREEDMMEHEDSFLSPDQPQVAAPRVGGRASAPFKTSTCMRLLKKELEKQQDPAIVERNFQRGLTRFVTLNRSSVPGQMPANQFALSMGRSFRVGWGPFGLIAHAGTSFKSKEMSAICKNSSAPTVTIECVGPAASISGSGDGSPRTPAAGVDAPLYAFLRAQSHAPKPHRAPLLAAPRASLGDPEEYNRFLGFAHEVRDCIRSSVYAEAGPGSSSSSSSEHPHQPLLQAVELVIALVGQQMPIAPQPSVPLYEDRDARNPQMWECRREALSRWLQNVCVDEPRDEGTEPTPLTGDATARLSPSPAGQLTSFLPTHPPPPTTHAHTQSHLSLSRTAPQPVHHPQMPTQTPFTTASSRCFAAAASPKLLKRQTTQVLRVSLGFCYKQKATPKCASASGSKSSCGTILETRSSLYRRGC